MSILVETAVPHLRESRRVFYDPELEFHFDPVEGIANVPRIIFIRQLEITISLNLGEVLSSRRAIKDGLPMSAVVRVVPHLGCSVVGQIGQYLGIVNIGGRRHRGMNELRLTVDANVRIHAEVPLVALTDLLHLRTAILLFVIGGIRRADDSRVYNGSAGFLTDFPLPILIHHAEQLTAQILLLHKVAKFVGCGGVLPRNRLPHEAGAAELVQRTKVLERFFDSGGADRLNQC